MTLHSETGTLTPAPPFDFARSLSFFGMLDPTRHEQSLEEGTLTKAVMIEGQTIIFRVKSAGTIQAPKLDYTLFSAKPITAHLKAAAADRLSFFLSLADDLRPFYEIAKHDPPFAPIVERLYGYHQVKFLTPFENACWAVLTQRNPIAAARKAKDRLTEKFGGKLEVDGAEYAAFPEAAQLVSVSPDELKTIIRNEQKVQYLSAVVAAFARVDEQFLRAGPYDEVASWLRNIKGIGAWSASFILIRSLGRMETILRDDKRLSEAASKVYGRTDLEQLAECYGPWRGYWAHYLRVAG